MLNHYNLRKNNQGLLLHLHYWAISGDISDCHSMCQAPRSMGFSKGSSPARDRTRVSSTGRQILYCCATWDSSIKKSPRGTEVLNKHQQNRTQAPLLSQKPGCRGRKVPQDWVMLGKELLFPLYLSQPQLLLFQLQTKVQDSTHKKPG